MAAAEFRFQVALSFAGENRDEVAALAEGLAGKLERERVLYDHFYQAEFAQPDLDVYLPRLYREQSELIVVFLCPDYAKKRWCRLEWRHIRQLIATVAAERIMFLRFGDPGDLSDLGILPGDGYADVQGWPATEIVELILERLEGRPGPAREVPKPVVDRSTQLEALKRLPAASFEELVFRYDVAALLPGKAAAQGERAIELLRALETREGGLAKLAADLEAIRRGGRG